VLLTLTTSRRPATDLGYLLVKHPDRVHRFDLALGTATVVFPHADEDRCTAALLLEADGRGFQDNTLNQHVNDRPYAASSLLAAALNRVFRTAMRGESKDRPELAAQPLPLEIRVPVLRCKGGIPLARSLFEPLGWSVAGSAVALDERFPHWGDGRYVDLTLSGEVRLADALNHLYLLLPVLDDAKHYWVGPDEIEKLLRAGQGWLARHPERPLIVKRYLAHSRALVERAVSAFEDQTDSVVPDEPAPKPKPLNQQRKQAVLAALQATGAARVLDLGCGGGALLADLIRDPRYTEIVGADVSPRSLELAERRLRLSRLPDRQRARIKLIQSSLTYLDDRLRGYDAAILMEVIEHLDPPRLPALAQAVFGHAAPATVIVTTPNSEYNVRYESLPTGHFRHSDHRFEFTRAEFREWAAEITKEYGYAVALQGVGEADPELGSPTQLAVFTK
jgi:3' terminal RNA ribose 2'-O-methyltransferase Hen1